MHLQFMRVEGAFIESLRRTWRPDADRENEATVSPQIVVERVDGRDLTV